MRPIEGILVPIVTPLTSDGSKLDLRALNALVENLLGAGVHGFFLLGTTGEGPSQSLEFRKQLIRETSRIVGARAPMLVGVTDTALDHVFYLAEEAKKVNADAVVLAPPPYFLISQTELLEYVGHIARRIDMPLFLYNNPKFTKVEFSPTTVLEASKIKNVAGMKDSSGDMGYFNSILSQPSLPVFMGTDELLYEVFARAPRAESAAWPISFQSSSLIFMHPTKGKTQ